MKDLYLISTFRHEWNRRYNSLIAPQLESRGLACYFAHRDTDQTGTRDLIFAQDMAGLSNCKTVLAISANESPNWGGEVGFAYGRRPAGHWPVPEGSRNTVDPEWHAD